MINDKNKYGVFVHALHKSASMFLFRLFKDLSEEANLAFYSVNNKPEPNHQKFQANIDISFCYCPIRHFADSPEVVPANQLNITPDFIIKDEMIVNIPLIYRRYQIRDPRDILVSQYFSFGFIHGGVKKMTPTKRKVQKMTIDEYCLLEADVLHKKYSNVLNIKTQNNPNYLIVKYETMVLEYKKWLAQVISVFQFKNKQEVFEKYWHKYKDEFDVENHEESMKHKRKMIPGDYKEKLKIETIEKLDSKFYDIINELYL